MNVEEVTRLLPARFGAVRFVEEIQVGLSGAAVHGVATDTGDYVLRIVPTVNRDVWSRELVVRRLTSDAGISPPLEWVDEEHGVTLTRRIGGQGFTPALAEPADRVRALGSLARTLAKLHALPGDDLILADPVAMARASWRTQRERAGFPLWTEAAFAHVDRAEQLLAEDTRRVPSHNDLNPANVLWDGTRVWLVDWEQSGLTHPYYDMAALTTFLVVDDDVALQLLAAQEGAAITGPQADTFVALRRVAMVLYGSVFFSLAPDLEAIVPQSLDDVPSMTEIYAMLASGALSLRSPEGQAIFGAAMLKRAL